MAGGLGDAPGGAPILSLATARDEALAAALDALREGRLVAFPTETVYGVGALHGHAEALARLRRAKERDGPFQVLVAGLDALGELGCACDGPVARIAEAFWPGALTLVLPSGEAGETVGVRWPDHPDALDLLRRLGQPIVASSANARGAPEPLTATEAARLDDHAALVLDGGRVPGGVASTVARVEGNELTILRAGAIAEEALREVWESS